MNEINNTLPDDVEELKSIIASISSTYEYSLDIKEEELAKERIKIERAVFELNEILQKYKKLEDKYNYLQKLFFGRRCEKLRPED